MGKITAADVTEITFSKTSKKIGFKFEQIDQWLEKIDQRFDRLEIKVDRMTVMLMQNDVDIKEIKATMMTREDGQKVLDVVQNLATKFEESDRAWQLHLNRFHEKTKNFSKNIVF